MEVFKLKRSIQPNSLLQVEFPSGIEFDEIKVVSSCFYSIFFDGDLVQFGPYRRTCDHLNLNSLKLNGNTNKLELRIIYYGVPSFDIETREFLFGIELYKNGKSIISSKDIKLFFDKTYIFESNKYSFQRGFVERYDLTLNRPIQYIELEEATKFEIISEYKDTCLYKKEEPVIKDSGSFKGFNKSYKGKNNYYDKTSNFIVDDILDSLNDGHLFYQYQFNSDVTGIFHLEIESFEPQTIYLVFDEYLPSGKWEFFRARCSDLIEIKLNKGINEIYSNVPYTCMHVMLISKYTIAVNHLESVLIQNDMIKVQLTGDKRIDNILLASSRTFAQNAVDLFTDCPGRERAGWLCDSYFSGIAEPFYTGNHNIEKAFLENFIYESSPEIPEGMVPMCYPSIHQDHTFIPNWSLWFIVEIERYFNDSKDFELINKLKEKVYQILNYFKKFENEYGLLENLESWEFIEWSDATEDRYIKPVSFVTNMLYKGAIESAANLYFDKDLLEKSKDLCKTINDLSFNGKYFRDNARRIDDKLVVTPNLISETAQYYAFFFNIRNDEQYFENVFNAKDDKTIVGSAVFIGKFLRLLNLYRKERYQAIIDEFVPYFEKMANITGTLWEKEAPEASCNHGFASVFGAVLFDCYKKTSK